MLLVGVVCDFRRMPKRQKDASASEDEYDLNDEAFIDDDDEYGKKPAKKKIAAKGVAAGKKKKGDGDGELLYF